MKKIFIVLALFNTLNMYSMENKAGKLLRDREHCRHQKKILSQEELATLAAKKKEPAFLNSNYPSYPRPAKKTLSAQDLEILAAQKKADSQNLKKEICVALSCYLCFSSTVVVSYYAGAYALGQLKIAATNYFFNTTNN